jgi:hypothetical protein
MHDVTQIVIPRYRQHPVGHQATLPINKAHSWGSAGILIGFGPDSVLRGTASGVYATGSVESNGTTTTNIVFKKITPTPAVDGLVGMYLRFTDNTTTTALRGQWRQIADSTAGSCNVSPAFGTTPAGGDAFEVFDPQPIVVTEDFFDPRGMHDRSAADPDTKAAAVCSAAVKDISILGPAIGGQVATTDYTNAGLVSNFLRNGTTGDYQNYVDRWHGLYVKGLNYTIDNVIVSYIAGTAIHATVGSGGNNNSRWYDTESSTVRDVVIRRCYRGLLYEDTDGTLGQIGVADGRDYGIKITGSAVTLEGKLHAVGIWTDDPDPVGKNLGIGIWITGNGAMGGPLYGDNCHTGLLLAGSRSRLTNINTLTNTHYGVRVVGTGHKLANLDIDLNVNPALYTPVGVSNENSANSYVDLLCEVSGNGTGCELVGNSGSYRAKLVRNVYVLDSDTKGVVVTGALKNSVLDLHVEESADSGITGTVALDVSDGTIGDYNRIYVTTGNISGGRQPDVIVDWPDSAADWTTTPKNTTSEIYINGRRYYPPTDEF